MEMYKPSGMKCSPPSRKNLKRISIVVFLGISLLMSGCETTSTSNRYSDRKTPWKQVIFEGSPSPIYWQLRSSIRTERTTISDGIFERWTETESVEFQNVHIRNQGATPVTIFGRASYENFVPENLDPSQGGFLRTIPPGQEHIVGIHGVSTKKPSQQVYLHIVDLYED